MLGNNDLPSDDRYTSHNTERKVKNSVSTSDNIERKVTPDSVKSNVKKQGAQFWDTDPVRLRDYSKNSVVNIFIDTIATDISNYEYTVKNTDTTDIQEFLRYGHPDKSFSAVIESTVRDLKIFGNHFWVLHKDTAGNIAEYVQPNPETMFIITDDQGYIDGYLYRDSSGQNVPLDKSEVIHFKNSASTNGKYAKSDIEPITDIIEIIDEIEMKEISNLREGPQSGVLSLKEDHPTDPMDSQEWDAFTDDITSKNKGKRHTFGVTRGDFEFIPFEDSYSDMELRDRYKMFIQVIAAKMDVNASYVGFDFENTNRATDESQRESYKERGVSNVLNKLAETINHSLIPELTDDPEATFTWDLKDTDEMEEVDYYERMGNAVEALQNAGIQAEVTDEDHIQLVGTISDDTNNNNNVDGDEMDEEQEKSDEYAALSKRKKEVVDAVENDSFAETIQNIDSMHKNRTDAIEHVDSLIKGTLSNSTYYNWVDEYVDE